MRIGNRDCCDGESDNHPGIAAGGDGGYPQCHSYASGIKLRVAVVSDGEWQCHADYCREFNDAGGEDQRKQPGAAGGCAIAGEEYRWGVFESGAADRNECLAGVLAGDQHDWSSRSAERNHLQRDDVGQRRNSWIHMVDYVGKLAGGIEFFKQRRDLGNADGERNIDVRCDRLGLGITGAESDGDAVDCGDSGDKRTRGTGNHLDVAELRAGGQHI